MSIDRRRDEELRYMKTEVFGSDWENLVDQSIQAVQAVQAVQN